MRYLQCAFAGEGPTDHAFFVPLVRRVVETIVLQDSDTYVQVPDPVRVLPGGHPINQPDAVVDEVKSSYPFVDLLFFHADAAGDPEAAYSTRVDRVRLGLADAGIDVVGVVPRRETEAWILADPEVVADTLGLRREALGIRAEQVPERVEGVLDPKADLRGLVNSQRSPRRRTRTTADLMGVWGARLRLEVLRRIPQGQRFIVDTMSVLQRRRVL